MASLTQLVWQLWLSSNKLSGSIPDSLCSLTQLRNLWLSSNNVCGSIPNSLRSLTLLWNLQLSCTNLCNSIPDSLRCLTQLKNLELFLDELSGPMPDSLHSLTQLLTLELSWNMLSGIVPDSLRTLAQLRSLILSYNKLFGRIPGAVSFVTKVHMLELTHNQLSGCIPHWVSSLTELHQFPLEDNHLSGRIPGAMSALTNMQALSLEVNRLSGCIPGQLGSLMQLKGFSIAWNKLIGSIPGAMSFLTRLDGIDLEMNQLSGCIPCALSSLTDASYLFLKMNKLHGPIPDGISSIPSLFEVRLGDNRLRGSIPSALSHHPLLSRLDVSSNELSGTLSMIESLQLMALKVTENRLTGSFPLFGRSGSIYLLMCSGNMLEGTLPANVMTSRLGVLDVSQKAGQMRGLEGQLPPAMSQAMALDHLMIAHQQLEGFIPPLTATLHTLALHGNRFSLFHGVSWSKDGSAIALMHMNLLSCSLPTCGDGRTNFSLVAIGNTMTGSHKALPQWVLPIERDGTLWRSGTEGAALLLKAMGSTILLVVIVAVKFRNGMLLRVLSRWHTCPHMRLVASSSWLIICMAHQVLVRAFLFIFLLSWDTYKCSPTLWMASMCLHDGSLNHLLSLILWSQLCFHLHKFDDFGPASRSVTREIHTRKAMLWLIPLTCILSSMSVLNQAMNAIPGFLGLGGFWSRALNSCVGVAQGLLGSVVLPRLAKKLSADNRASFLVISGLFANCILPATVIVVLDTHCLGRWPAFWDPCRIRPERFNRVAEIAWIPMQAHLLSSDDICDSHQARTQTTLSNCVQVAFLRLQDLWLPKIITSGVVVPAGRLARQNHYTESTQIVGALAVYIVYAMLTAGHLPLVMPLLGLSMLSITVLAAVSWHDPSQRLRHDVKQSIASTLTLPQVFSASFHAASATGNAIALACFSVIVICRIARITLSALSCRPAEKEWLTRFVVGCARIFSLSSIKRRCRPEPITCLGGI